MVLQPLKDIAVVNGKTARFECIVQGEPISDVMWSCNGQVLENSDCYQTQYRNGVCRLTIPRAYQCECHVPNGIVQYIYLGIKPGLRSIRNRNWLCEIDTSVSQWYSNLCVRYVTINKFMKLLYRGFLKKKKTNKISIYPKK